jgi:hypothetical protein
MKKTTQRIKHQKLNERIAVLRKDFHDETDKKSDTVWMVRFTTGMASTTEDPLHALLCDPVQTIVDWCEENLKITKKSFLPDHPITITFTYASNKMDWEEGENGSLDYVAYGMHGSNIIHVECPYVHLPENLSDPQSVKDMLIKDDITDFDPQLDVVVVKDTHSIIAHYDLQIDEFGTDKKSYNESKMRKVNRMTSSLIKKPYLLARCLSEAPIRSWSIVDMKNGTTETGTSTSDKVMVKKIDLHLRSKEDKDTERLPFIFTFITKSWSAKPLTAPQKPNQTKPIPLSSTQSIALPSNCIGFQASYDINDPLSTTGVFIAHLINGQQMRWLEIAPLQSI